MFSFETSFCSAVIGDWAVFEKGTNKQVITPTTYGNAINELDSRGHDKFEIRRVK